ncbi:HAD family hydrolase [Pseudocolwellia agarivorans]|uniref:HAD family hydrolase n=1 Tax=Pseudocolwellia agarivorans TaxID=1911682 RepID=UPI0009870383|nr:HAD family hydrolase [Pseudocolwellia agarivorans]
MKKNVLITDLDNTLFDWFGVWYASNFAMIERICSISGVNKETILSEMKSIHQKHGTAEYAFLLESLPSLQKLYGEPENIKEVMNDAIYAFRKARKHHLKLYDTVEDTLKKLKEIGVYIVAYTESKSYYTSYRIKKLGLDNYIDVLYSPPDHELPDSEGTHTKFEFSQMDHKFTPDGEFKPNPTLLLDIIKDIGSTPSNCIYVGDSEMKDMDMAQQAGVSDVFAKYGTAHFSGNTSDYDLLRAVTHWTNEDVQREIKIKEQSHNNPPNYTINAFEEILTLFSFQKFTSKLS